MKRILQSTTEDRKPAKFERLGVKAPFTNLPSFNVSALVISYKCYEFEAGPLLKCLSKNASRYYKSHNRILNGFLRLYRPPSNSLIKPEDVQKHIDDIAMPYYRKLAAGHLLT